MLGTFTANKVDTVTADDTRRINATTLITAFETDDLCELA